MEVYPVVFSNDGTALKPSIQFDKDRNVNVGLKNHEMTLEQCQSKPFLEKKLVLEKLICKSVFSSVTVLNNDICLPVAVHYCSKLENPVIISKKPSLTKFDSFKCVKIASLELRWKYGFDKEQLPSLWELLCDNCFTSDSVRANCSIKGQTKVNPALRACD